MVMFGSVLKGKGRGGVFFSSFYLVSGSILFFVWAWYEFHLIHIGILGVLSFLASYGLGKMRRWAVLLVAIISTSGLALSAVTIYYLLPRVWSSSPNLMILQFLMGVYAALSLASLIYVLAKRNTFE